MMWQIHEYMHFLSIALAKTLLRDYLIKPWEPQLFNDSYSSHLVFTSGSNLSSHLQPDLDDLQRIGKENLGGSPLEMVH